MKPERERILGSRPHGGKDVSRTSFGIVYRVMGSNLAPEISMRPDTVPGLSTGPDSRRGGDSMLPTRQHGGCHDRESHLETSYRVFLFARNWKKREIPRSEARSLLWAVEVSGEE